MIATEKGEERLYSLADPNWNVVAITDSSGAALERMRYDAFGKITWLDEDFDTKIVSDFTWNRAFTGQAFDNETGLLFYRMRFYHAGFGVFLTRDPIDYLAGDINLNRYCANNPHNHLDPSGEWIIVVVPVAIVGVLTLVALYKISKGIKVRNAFLETVNEVGGPHVPGSEIVGALEASADVSQIKIIMDATDRQNETTNDPNADTKKQNDTWENLNDKKKKSGCD